MTTRWFELTDPCYHHHSLLPLTPRLSTLPFFTSFEEDDLLDVDFALDLLTPKPVNAFSDLIRVERAPSSYSYTRVLHRALPGPELWLEELSERVSALETRFDRVISHSKAVERKYTWSAEIKGEPERKYKWTAEIKGASCVDKRKEKVLGRIDDGVERKYKWTAEIEGKADRAARKYTIEVQSGGEHSESKKKEKEKETKSGKKEKNATRIVEIEDETSPDHGTLVLRQVYDDWVYVLNSLIRMMSLLSAVEILVFVCGNVS